MLKIALLGVRGIQILFSAVVLGLSITLGKGQVVGHWPTTYSYAAFLGGFGMIAGAFGILCVFVHLFDHTIINLAIDGVVALLYIAGGAALAIQLKGGCTNVLSMLHNKLINCGAVITTIDGEEWFDGLCGVTQKTTFNDLINKEAGWLHQRCSEATADYGLMFGVVLTTLLAVGLTLLWRRKGSGGYAV